MADVVSTTKVSKLRIVGSDLLQIELSVEYHASLPHAYFPSVLGYLESTHISIYQNVYI